MKSLEMSFGVFILKCLYRFIHYVIILARIMG